MDFSLRCNSLKCRRQLGDRAVVTTCSHIFCIQCSDSLGLSNTASNERACPACDTRLVNADDAVATQLNPSEDYKTSVLSGLSPSLIMECAGRGLSFYSYQATQEIIYQEFLAKSLTEKYSVLSLQMDQIIHDANTEIVSLRTKISGLQIEQNSLRKNNDELLEAYNEKLKAQRKSQTLYDNLKKQMLQSDVQLAAANAADTMASASMAKEHHVIPGIGLQRSRRDNPYLPIHQGQGETSHHRRESGSSGGDARLRHNRQLPSASMKVWNGAAHMSLSDLPSEQRTRLPVATPQASRVTAIRDHEHATFNYAGPNSSRSSTTQPRQPLGSISANIMNGLGTAGYGLSAGMKMGQANQASHTSRKGSGGTGLVSMMLG